ncbi:hypothetical protein [Streptomyces wuyuanensis]|uniref:hypothetical protein n=1 Tax=Streptomyces wuyuanensis TaxID=1196353 RepID=UPI003D7276E9
MTPKLRTHCATTLAALVLGLPVATYAHAESPLTHAEDARGEEGGQHGGSGREGRHGGPGREAGRRYGGEARDERGPHGGKAHGGGGGYGRDAHGEERGYSGGQGGGADDDGPDRPTHRDGIPAHGAPSAPRAEGSSPSPDNDGDRPAAARPPGKPRTPPAGTAAERPDPSPSASLAGRQAGEGRLRPGRTAAPSLGTSPSPDRPHDHDGHEHGVDRGREPDGDMTPHAEDESQAVPDEPSPSEPTPADDASPAAAGESHPRPVSQPLERQIPVLTLGAGCALMGLGLGYMGLRLRRG